MSNRRSWSCIVCSLAIAVVPFWLVACSSGGGDVGTTGQRPASSALKALETVTASSATSVSSPPALDGAVSFATATATVSTISFAHTTGSGADRLTLVGIAANNYSTTRTLSSVTFTPSGGSAIALSPVGSVQNGNGRLSAIYSLLAPPSGASGTMAVNFSGSVGYGIVAGAANFKGVDQAVPLGQFASTTSTTTTVSLSVPSSDGELVFDTVFLGAPTLPTVTEGAAQSPLWNSSASRTLGAVSTKAASSSTTTMSWTATTASNWAVGGVSINPSGGGVPVAPDFSILLGRPTNASITANIIPNHSGDCYVEYGTSPSSYGAGQTGHFACVNGVPVEVVVEGLSAHTQYYYRLQFKASSSTGWAAGAEHSFWTQRAQGNSFAFTVTADSHESFTATEQNAMTNISNERPDFEIDLGDTFITDNLTTQTAVNNKYLAYRKPSYFDQFSHSAPIFLSSGNHENEEGWNLDDTPLSLAQASIQARKLYYPTPINGGFYSGNTDILGATSAGTSGDQYREDYYAWTWGDALFVVIDPFQYTMNLSYTPAAGEGTDDTKTGDQWSWTLGAKQYNWLKSTLQNSIAKYKFMFSHQMVGGIPRGPIGGAEAGYVRGGAEAAAYFEWGGENADGTAGFAAHRDAAVFGTKPIHQLMRETGVSAYFHGHDHQYVYEKRDGIVYQEVPSPGTAVSAFSGVYTEGDHGTYNTIKMLSNSGHLRIAVNPTQTTVDYISAASTSGTVNDSYTIAPNPTQNQPPVVNAGPDLNVAGTTTSLNALGADDGGEANLTYTWATVGPAPAAVTFSANGTNAAKNTTATFRQAGSYSLQVTVKDQPGLTGTGIVAVTVNQTPTSIVVAPASSTILPLATQPFVATVRDQFAAALPTQPVFTWSVSGGGTISSSGLFTAGVATGGPYTVTAESGSATGTATVTLTQATVYQINCGGAAAYPYTADQYVSGGTARTVTNTITTTGVMNPAPQAVYQAERYGAVTYALPNLTAGASYTVRLHFAELYWTAGGKRKFNVAINGTTVLSNFDIYSATGAQYTGIVKEFAATANSSGQIVIKLTNVINNATIGGIQLIRQ